MLSRNKGQLYNNQSPLLTFCFLLISSLGSLDFVWPHFRVLAFKLLAVQEVWLQSCYYCWWNIGWHRSCTIIFRGQYSPYVHHVLLPVWPGLQHVLRVFRSSD